MINVLITSAGGDAAVNVIKALCKQTELDLCLIAADANPLAAGLYLADKARIVPKINDPGYLPEIRRICEEEEVKAILPTYSAEIPLFAMAEGLGLLVPDSDTAGIFANKWLTNYYFQRHEIKTPRTWGPEMYPDTFPLYLKPLVGSGTKDNHIARNREELNFYRNRGSYVAQEYVQGPEYTVDCLAHKGQLLAAVARQRVRVKAGGCVIAETVTNGPFMDTLQKLAGMIEGPFNVQAIQRKGELLFTDVNLRFASGGLSLAVEAGANIPLMVVKLILGQPVKPVLDYPLGRVMTRYYSEVFTNG